MVRVHSGSQHRVVEESGLSRFVWDEEHAGSNPAYPTEFPHTPYMASGPISRRSEENW